MSDVLDEPERKRKGQSYLQKRYKPMVFIFPVVLIGLVFRVMHWPGGSVFFLTGLSLMAGHAIAIVLNFQKNEMIANLGAMAFPLGVAFYVFNTFNSFGWAVGGAFAFVSAISIFLWLREKS